MKHYVSEEVAEKLLNLSYKDHLYSDTEYRILIEMYEVQDWFRDKNVIVLVTYNKLKFGYLVYLETNLIFENNYDGKCSTYYEALEAGINKAIEIYENIK